MFEELLNSVRKKLYEFEKIPQHDEVINHAFDLLLESTAKTEELTVNQIYANNDEFIQRNRNRWKIGFRKLHLLRETCLEAGVNFQKQVLLHFQYKHDELIGVLLRQHAHACRISGEILHLLEGGYADAALARWRTLYEIAVTCLVIKKYGKEAAIDYIRHGMVKAVEGIEEHYKTAEAMGVETFTAEEVEIYKEYKEEITDGDKSWHWARKYAGFSKFEKLREHVGLGKWSHNYKLASRNVHSDYFEMASLHAMSEAREDMLLCGQSDSGLAEPAHFTAITLSQITSTFITSYIDDDDHKLDYDDSTMFLKLIQNYVDEVGEAFLDIQKTHRSTSKS